MAAGEPGCTLYHANRSTENPDLFLLYEHYRDQAALAAHRETPHFKEFFAALPNLANGDLIRHMTQNVVPNNGGFVR